MNFVIDIILILIFAVTALNGFRRGFVRSLTDLVTNLISVVAARILSAQLAPQVYSSYFEAGLTEKLTKSVGDLGSNASQQVSAALDKIPGISGFLSVAGVDQSSVTANVSEQINNEGASVVDALMTNLVSPVATFVVRVVIFVLAFIVCVLVMKLISRLLDKAVKLPVLKQANKSLGFLFGVIKGLILVAVLCAVFLLVAGFTGDGGFNQLVANSKIVGAFSSLIGTISFG